MTVQIMTDKNQMPSTEMRPILTARRVKSFRDGVLRNTTRRNPSPEKIAFGLWLRQSRETLGYTRSRFARMLGYTGTKKALKRRFYMREHGQIGMSQENVATIKDWLENGMPIGSPLPNLHISREAFWKQHKASFPRVLDLGRAAK